MKNKRYGHPRFYELIEELAELHNNKNRDYATPEDPLVNFTRTGELAERYGLIAPGKVGLKMALLYSLKQIDAVFKMVGRGQKETVEGVRDKLRDIAVYAIIAMILEEEGK